MKVMVVGGGGREHALVWKLSQSKKVARIFVAPGNPGTAAIAENIMVAAEDVEGLKAFALARKVDLTVVGPEVPLTLGIVDVFEAAGLKIFGPTRAAAELEGSKVFSKEFMLRHKIPTAHFKKFDSIDVAKTYVELHEPPFVVKADGLAAGKGVIICENRTDAYKAVDLIMQDKAFGSAGARIIIEGFLKGEEASFMAVTDGKTVVPLATAQDHKTIYDDDEGPNTGGMGAYSPAPVITPALTEEIMEKVMRPTVAAMSAEGKPYKGVLYAGIMVCGGKPMVLEFNCRFGDPETQPVMMRLEDDLFDILYAAADGTLTDRPLKWTDKAAVCVVMASHGYPGHYERGKVITGLDAAAKCEDAVVFHAGTVLKDDIVVTSGGRVLGVTALGAGVKDAIDKAYAAVKMIRWDGVYYRTDIGRKAAGR